MNQMGLFTTDEAGRHAEIVEREKQVIADFEANQVEATSIWIVMRNPRPVSYNAAVSGKGRRFYTAEGKAFLDGLKKATAQAIMFHSVLWKHVVDAVYKQGGHIRVTIWMYVDDLLNPHWEVGGNMTAGKPHKNKKSTRETKPRQRSPYMQKDASNYLKLIEDAVVKGTGIDDAAHLDVTIKKRHDAADPRIVIEYKVFD